MIARLEADLGTIGDVSDVGIQDIKIDEVIHLLGEGQYGHVTEIQGGQSVDMTQALRHQCELISAQVQGLDA